MLTPHIWEYTRELVMFSVLQTRIYVFPQQKPQQQQVPWIMYVWEVFCILGVDRWRWKKHHAASLEPLGNTDTLDSTAIFC